MDNQKSKSNGGFTAFYLTILILATFFIIAVSISILTYGEGKISQNIVKSSQTYYTAEAGIEDALLKLVKKMSWSSPYDLKVGSSTTTVEISNIVGGSRTITSRGNVLNRIRKIQIVYAISTQEVSFHYGAQVGDGGMVMGNNSQVQGNVFSNGSVIGGGTIANSIIVAINGNRIEGITVGEDATVHTCKDSNIGGILTYVSGGSLQNCTAGESIKTRPNQIDPEPLPISQSQIGEWKAGAAAGGVNPNDVTISGTQSIGPIQIGTMDQPKNLTVNNGATLKLNGTIYVTGNITFNQNSKVQLESSYGSLSGVMIADGTITVENGTQLSGSGQTGSYILILSTKNDTANPVINIRNNAAGAVFYANAGLIYLKNNMTAREITGYKVQLENNAVIQYESGLENANFSNGPGGSWKVVSWKEIE